MDEVSTAQTFLEIGVGLLVLVLVIFVHGAGIRWISRRFNRKWSRLGADATHWRADAILAVAVASLAALHLVETLLWAVPIYSAGLIPGLRDSYYFVLECYTTLGEGNVRLPDTWRLIGPIVAMSGLFTFGWTAGVLVSIMSDFGKLERLRAEQKENGPATGSKK